MCVHQKKEIKVFCNYCLNTIGCSKGVFKGWACEMAFKQLL